MKHSHSLWARPRRIPGLKRLAGEMLRAAEAGRVGIEGIDDGFCAMRSSRGERGRKGHRQKARR